jgi:hypothetical protein
MAYEESEPIELEEDSEKEDKNKVKGEMGIRLLKEKIPF